MIRALSELGAKLTDQHFFFGRIGFIAGRLTQFHDFFTLGFHFFHLLGIHLQARAIPGTFTLLHLSLAGFHLFQLFRSEFLKLLSAQPFVTLHTRLFRNRS